ncbi:hypothetical protein GXB81_18175 [Paraburkholderia sp. Ac-20336]|uniref:hypothetical protein n=1 Tax=Paraburkholderia sp. Ac-20336 TaxID=2703886 RepID=UPI00197F2BFF|nr:hypothetical protein [Paraburkholderia sp. Ac-20336]MBN3804963.1 hypothetical protein [Paraburkholderia sp. Ac-20336]
MQIRIAEENRKQLVKQSGDTLDVQRLVTNRATASFVADKRQKWIDELRTDMAAHLALSQEIAWKWLALYSEAEEVAKRATASGNTVNQESIDKQLKEFSQGNGARDREHQERHIRLRLRLNGKEGTHIELIDALNEIRMLVTRLGAAKYSSAAHALTKEMEKRVLEVTLQTTRVLKDEWTRVKQEVAYPELLLSTIIPPNINAPEV